MLTLAMVSRTVPNRLRIRLAVGEPVHDGERKGLVNVDLANMLADMSMRWEMRVSSDS